MRTIQPPHRILLGPGPSNVDYRVYRAMTTPILGHMDPEFMRIMDGVRRKLQTVFNTANQLTIPVSGTGSAGMEAALVNFLEPGDTAVISTGGVFADRMCDIVQRARANLVRVESEWGQAADPERLKQAIRSAPRPVRLLAVVHGETSTGVLQPLEPLARLAREAGALFVVDAVATLGGAPLRVDALGIDVCYTGSQKCLSCPPGLAPITVSETAVQILHGRKTKVQSWYLDLSMVEKYWGRERLYHHTAPISMVFALDEALRIVLEEGLEARIQRHAHNMAALLAGLAALGLEPFPAAGCRMPTLAVVRVPEGVDDASVRSRLLHRFDIEIAGGLGKFKGKLWRIGLMGSSSTESNVLLVLSALEILLAEDGFLKAAGKGVAAAQGVLAAHRDSRAHPG
jgi:alanine-glyoxylate transaminase/serine-glyoxylate transaminase/serine-pyruvate transaminase